MGEVVRQGPLQWGMAWGEWLTFQDERRSQYPGWWCELEVPYGTTTRTLEEVATALIERHEVLRTTFEASDDGEPLQRVWRHAKAVVHDLRWTTAEELKAFRNDDFMVDSQWPCRFALALNAVGSTTLLASVSHIALDYWAKELLWRDLEEILRSALEGRPVNLEPVECQPLDYALYERSEQTRVRRERARAYWRRQLERIPVAVFGVGELPELVRYVDCRTDSRTAAMQLGRIANRLNLPLSAVFSAVYAIALGAATSKKLVPLDLTSHGRLTRTAMNVVASLAGGVVIPVPLEPGQTFADLAAKIHIATFEAVRHSTVDIMEYTEWRTVSGGMRGGEIGSRMAMNFMYRQEGAVTAEAPAESDVAWDVAVGDPTEYLSRSHNLYLAAGGSDGLLRLQLSANEAVLGRDKIEALATGITAILELLDSGKASDVQSLQAEITSRFDTPPGNDDPGLASVRGDSVRPAAIDLALECIAGVKASRTVIAEIGEIITTVEVSDDSLNEAELFTLLRAQRPYRETLRTVPDRILIVRAETPEHSAVKREGVESAAASALAECVRSVNGLPSVDVRLSYTECGGRFFRAPAVLRHLRELGYEGLNRNDMQLPCSLAILAERLRPSRPHSVKRLHMEIRILKRPSAAWSYAHPYVSAPQSKGRPQRVRSVTRSGSCTARPHATRPPMHLSLNLSRQ